MASINPKHMADSPRSRHKAVSSSSSSSSNANIPVTAVAAMDLRMKRPLAMDLFQDEPDFEPMISQNNKRGGIEPVVEEEEFKPAGILDSEWLDKKIEALMLGMCMQAVGKKMRFFPDCQLASEKFFSANFSQSPNQTSFVLR